MRPYKASRRQTYTLNDSPDKTGAAIIVHDGEEYDSDSASDEVEVN